MREGLPGAAGEDLSLHALLYATGELEGEELAAFEQKLALDQSARDALAQAVELSLTLEGKADQGPEPEVRNRIRQRLRQRRRNRLREGFGTGFVGHPALWSLIGVLATLVFLLVFSQVLALYENQTAAPPPPRTKADLLGEQARLEAEADKIATLLPAAADRPALEAKLKEISRQLVANDLALQKMRVEQMEEEIQLLKKDLAGDLEERIQRRYEGIVKPR